MHVHACTYIHIHTCTHVHTHIHSHTHMYICTHAHTFTYAHVHMHTCTYTHPSHACIYTHTYTAHRGLLVTGGLDCTLHLLNLSLPGQRKVVSSLTLDSPIHSLAWLSSSSLCVGKLWLFLGIYLGLFWFLLCCCFAHFHSHSHHTHTRTHTPSSPSLRLCSLSYPSSSLRSFLLHLFLISSNNRHL